MLCVTAPCVGGRRAASAGNSSRCLSFICSIRALGGGGQEGSCTVKLLQPPSSKPKFSVCCSLLPRQQSTWRTKRFLPRRFLFQFFNVGQGLSQLVLQQFLLLVQLLSGFPLSQEIGLVDFGLHTQTQHKWAVREEDPWLHREQKVSS